MNALKMAWRGTGRLPHVGEHPGTPLMLGMMLIGITIGASRSGLTGGLFGLVFMFVTIGPWYLLGAYNRARTSERLSSNKGAE